MAMASTISKTDNPLDRRKGNLNANGLLSAVFYGVGSTSMAFINKLVLNKYEFDNPFFIMTCQMLVTALILYTVRIIGLANVTPVSWQRCKSFMLPSMFYALHAILSLSALSDMNIPMYGTLKRTTPLINLMLAVCLLNKKLPSTLVIVSVLVITFGCLIAGFGDLTFDAKAYSYCFASVFAQAIYQTLVQRAAEEHKNALDATFLNSINTFPLFASAFLLFGEWESVRHAKFLNDVGFQFTFVILSIMGAMLNYLLFLCTMLNSALTTSLVGVAKSVVQTGLGFLFLGGVVYHPLNIAGIVLNTLGGFMYTFAKFSENSETSHRQKIDAKNASVPCV